MENIEFIVEFKKSRKKYIMIEFMKVKKFPNVLFVVNHLREYVNVIIVENYFMP